MIFDTARRLGATLLAMLQTRLALAAVELEYRRQRMVRRAVAREVSEHMAELRSRWSVLDRRRG